MTKASSWLAEVVVLVVAFMSLSGGQAFGVIGGKTIPISAAPWNVLVTNAGQGTCTGVIIGSRQVLTAGHCVTFGESGQPVPASGFTIEAGVSNFNHPHKTDYPQTRDVSEVRLMPGYVPERRWNDNNRTAAVGHDLAVLTLSRPLDLAGVDARAASLPSAGREPSPKTRLVMAGYGDESDNDTQTGNLNEITHATMFKVCGTSRVLCEFEDLGTCWGDSGAGLIEPGQHPTVVGILSEDQANCSPGLNGYVALAAPTILRFIKTSKLQASSNPPSATA